MDISYREAALADITQLQYVRHAVKENVLSDPSLVPDKDVEDYIINRGKGWVCEVDDKIVGFAIADLKDNSIWALFLLPEFEGKGIGRKLQELMLGWYFNQTKEKLWLTTAPGTRAETFYRKSGWNEVGRKNNGEIKFELTFSGWQQPSAETSR